MRKILLTIILTLIASTPVFAERLLFVGETCPHCKALEQYLDQHNLFEELNIQRYEIYNNEENLELYLKETYKLQYKNGQVPLLIDDGAYYEGNNSIQDHLREVQDGEIESGSEPLTAEDNTKLNNIIQKEAAINESDTKVIGVVVILAGLSLFVGIWRRGTRRK
jgi:glutaredoxin